MELHLETIPSHEPSLIGRGVEGVDEGVGGAGPDGIVGVAEDQ